MSSYNCKWVPVGLCVGVIIGAIGLLYSSWGIALVGSLVYLIFVLLNIKYDFTK